MPRARRPGKRCSGEWLNPGGSVTPEQVEFGAAVCRAARVRGRRGLNAADPLVLAVALALGYRKVNSPNGKGA